MKGEWDVASRILNQAARRLQGGDTELTILATNTMQKFAGPMMAGVHLQLIHIADATANAISAAGLNRPGLMATVLTVEQSF